MYIWKILVCQHNGFRFVEPVETRKRISITEVDKYGRVIQHDRIHELPGHFRNTVAVLRFHGCSVKAENNQVVILQKCEQRLELTDRRILVLSKYIHARVFPEVVLKRIVLTVANHDRSDPDRIQCP